MSQQRDISDVLRRHFSVEEKTLDTIASELEDAGEFAQARAAAKQKILKKLELHWQADDLVEEIVARYREHLYFNCRRLAEEDLESGVITRAHVRRAQVLLGRTRRRYSWGDGLLAVGGLLVGVALPDITELARGVSNSPSPFLVCLGFAGALLLGMGIIDKAKS